MAFFPILLMLSSLCIESAFLSGMAGLLLCKEIALFVLWFVVHGFSSVNFCCSNKHWPNTALWPLEQCRTTEAELFFLHHLRSCAASARGSRSTCSSGSRKIYDVTDTMRFARWCQGVIWWGAQVYTNALYIYTVCRFCAAFTMRWQTAVALASGHPVLAIAFFEALTLTHPFENVEAKALRCVCAHAAWIAIALGVHAPRLWQCRAISALFCASLCSESLLPAVISAMYGWTYPAFPPKLTPERIQEKLVELRAYVANHADVMSLRPGANVLEKLRQTVSKEEKAWHNFLTKIAKSFTVAHAEHLAATYILINDTVAPGASGASTDANPESQISTQTSVASSAEGTYTDHVGQLGFTTSGQLHFGVLQSFVEGTRVNVRWRRQFAGAPDIQTPRRNTTDEAIQDYIFCFRAQEGLNTTTAQIQAMRTAAHELAAHELDTGTYCHLALPRHKVIGKILERHGTYCYRIDGKYTAEGPRRLTHAEAAKDGAEVSKAASVAKSEEERRMIARDVLRSLSKGLSYADSEKVKAAECRFTATAKQLALSQAAEKHAVPLTLSLEMDRIQHLIRKCAEIPQLHGLRWSRVTDITPQPYGKSAQEPFPGLRNLGNTCFLNAVCQCFVHVSSLRQRLRAPDAILPLLPRQDLALSMERFVLEYVEQSFAILSPVDVVKDFFLSWCSARPLEELLAGVQHDAVEATTHIIEECGLLGDCLRTGHTSYPDGVISCSLPDGFSARHTCSIQELLQNTLHDGEALERCPEVLAIAFANMYQEDDVTWWADLDLTGLNDDIDLSSCVRSAISSTDATYSLRACVIHRHSGSASQLTTNGHYISHFCEGGTWYVADDTYVRTCTPLTTASGAHLFPYILFLQKQSVSAQFLQPFTCSHLGDDSFETGLLERAPHLEFDATSLRALPHELRESFDTAVTSLLNGTPIDALSSLHRFMLGKCSRVLEAVTLVSSEEEISQSDSDGSLSPSVSPDTTALPGSVVTPKGTYSNEGGAPTDSSVAFGAVDEGKPGKRAAEDAASAMKKVLKKTVVVDSISEAKSTRSNEGGAQTDSSVAFGAMDGSRPGKRAAEDAAGGTKNKLKKGLFAYFNYSPSISSPSGQEKQNRTERKRDRSEQKRDRTERKQDRTERKQNRTERKQDRTDHQRDYFSARSRKDFLAEKSAPIPRFEEEWACLEKNPHFCTSFRSFAREPEPMAPIVCLFCESYQGGDFICEEDLIEHVKAHHGGRQHYRNNVMYLYSKRPPFVGGQMQRAIVRNFSEFLARGALGWKHFDHAMVAAAGSTEGLPSAMRWEPRAWVACVVCALCDWGETRIPAKIGGEVCSDDCPKDCTEHCFFKNPAAVAELLSAERYVDDVHWYWLPKDEVKYSCPNVLLHIGGTVQRRRLMLHRRRMKDEAACDGRRSVPVCRPCYAALSSKKPRLPTQSLANGNWLGRHPEILRQMPYAHRLLLPTARVISQRVVFAATNGQDWEKAFKQKGMEGIVLVVPQAATQKQVLAFPPKDLGDTFQAIFVGVNPDDTTRGLVATVTKKLYELQVELLRKHNLVVQSCQYDAEEVAKWKPTEVSKTITECFQQPPTNDEEEEGIGDTKLRGPADATSAAFDSGEAADNLPFVSLPDTEMEGGDDPLALAMIAAEKQTIMKEQALRIQTNEAKSGHHLQDAVGKKLLLEQAEQWASSVKRLSKLSTVDVQRRCGRALQGVGAAEHVLVVPTKHSFVRMYDSDFWSKFNPMDWCYGDAVYNDPRRDIQLTFEEFCDNLLRREELEYDLYDGENYEAEHYGKEHWHLRTDVESLWARHRLAKDRQARDCLEPTRPEEFFHVNRFRRWWVNLHVIASFWRLLSGFQSVSVSLQLQGVQTRLREVAELHPSTIAAAQGDKEQPGTTKAVQAVRNLMSMFNLATGTVVGSDGYRIQCRHAGQAYTILWGPPFVFTTPNLADTRNVTLLLVQGMPIDLEDEAGDVCSYAELRLRLVHDPVGQAIVFELYIRLFYLFVLGVRPDCVAQPRGAKGHQVPEEWCTDGVAASVVVFGSYGPLLAARGEVEASGRGSLHPHIEAWAVCQHLREHVHELMKDMKTFKHRLRRWIREWVNAINSMHHSSVANFPKLFRDTHAAGELPAVTPDLISRTRMDGGVDAIPGYHPKQRARILPESVAPQVLGPDDAYLPERARCANPPSKVADSEGASRPSDDACPPPPPAPSSAPRRPKLTLRGGICSSFPAFRRQKVDSRSRKQTTPTKAENRQPPRKQKTDNPHESRKQRNPGCLR